MEKVDKLIHFAKSVGLEDEDLNEFDTLEEIEGKIDLAKYTGKVFENHKLSLKGDTEFTGQFTKDFDQTLIGKENQKKKAIRKEFGLDISEEDLKKMPFETVLKKAKEVTAGTKDTDLQTERQKYLDEVESKETMKAEYEAKLLAEQGKTAAFEKSFHVKNKQQTAILAEFPALAKNIDMALAAYDAGLLAKGWKIDQDQKGHLILLDDKGNVAMANNAPVKVSETIKEFFAIFAPSKNGKGDLNNFNTNDKDKPRIPHPSEKYLEMSGKGLME